MTKTITFTVFILLFCQVSSTFAQRQFFPGDALWFIGATPEDVRTSIINDGYKAVKYSNDQGYFEKNFQLGTVNFQYSAKNGLVNIVTWTEFLGEAPQLFNYFIDLGYSTARNGDIHVFSSPDGKLQVVMELKRNSHEVEIGVAKHPRYQGKITRSYPPKRELAEGNQSSITDHDNKIPFQGTKYFLDPESPDFVTIVTINGDKVSTKLVPSVTGQFYKDWLKEKYIIHENSGYLKDGRLYQNNGQKWNFTIFKNGKYAEMRPNSEASDDMRVVEFKEITNKAHFPVL